MADDKLIYTYVPALIDYYLGEQPLLPNVATHRLDEPDVLAYALERADQLVFKPVDGSGGHGIVIGPHASDEELAAVGEQVLASPRRWIAQELVMLSTVPSKDGDVLRPRHVDLRPFATNDGERVHVLPGGLTRVALREGHDGGQLQPGRRVQGHLGAHVGEPPTRQRQSVHRAARIRPGRGARPRSRQRAGRATTAGRAMLSRAAEALFWIGRYVERAEDTARLLDVYFHDVIENPEIDEGETCRVVASVMGVHDQAPLTVARCSTCSPSTAPIRARSSDRSVPRGRTPGAYARPLSGEIWECLNTTDLELPRRVSAARQFGPAPFFTYIRQRSAMLAGYVTSTISRDNGYDFLLLGRSIERADMTARLLAAAVERPRT